MTYNLNGAGCDNLWAEQVTIKSGTSESEAIPTQGHAPVAAVMPAAWTSAQLGFKAGLAPNALQVPKDNTGAVEQAVVAASTFVVFPTSDAIFAPFLSVTSVDSGGNAVNQGADRVITLIFRRLF